jgi:tricorn protease-like protein
MAVFLWDEFEVQVTTSTISRALKSIGWSKKVARRVAADRSADLRDLYLYDLSSFEPYHVVYVDESGCDKRVGYRRTGWSPLGVTLVQIARFQPGQRYHILPAYTQNGILLSHIFQGTTDSTVFEDFIEQLLPHCGK